jgi:Protein of unknown function (DUF3592)
MGVVVSFYIEAVSFATGAFLVLLALWNARKGLAARNWIRVPGVIKRSFVMVQKGDDAAAGHHPAVEYEYSIEGKKYSGSRIRYGQIGSQDRSGAERVIAPYQPGTQVEVFVNSRKPSDAALVSGVSWGNLVIALAGLVFLAAGVLFEATRN